MCVWQRGEGITLCKAEHSYLVKILIFYFDLRKWLSLWIHDNLEVLNASNNNKSPVGLPLQLGKFQFICLVCQDFKINLRLGRGK